MDDDGRRVHRHRGGSLVVGGVVVPAVVACRQRVGAERAGPCAPAVGEGGAGARHEPGDRLRADRRPARLGCRHSSR